MNLDSAHLKGYLALVARKHGGVEGLLDVMEKRLGGRPMRGLESATEDNARVAAAAVKILALNRDPTPPQRTALEAIIKKEIRPAIDIVDGRFDSTHPLWTKLSTDAALRQRLETCIQAVGRLELPGNSRVPYAGTAFLVGDGLLMTNRHVAEIFAAGLGTRLQFKPGARAAVDFLKERGRPPGRLFAVRRLVMVHPYWDMALLEVEGLAGRAPLKLSLADARDLQQREIAVIGYPFFDPRNPADVQHDLFAGNYGIKRLQPGELQGAMRTASFGKLVNAATHDCSTLGGNSGSAVIDLETGSVMAVHFGGVYEEQNYAVPAHELSRDARVVDAGVNFEGTPRTDATDWADWWRRADATEEPDTYPGGDIASASRADPDASGFPALTRAVGQATEVSIDIPVRLTISIGTGQLVDARARAAVATEADAIVEAMREPFHDMDYSTRTGYDARFLDESSNGAGTRFEVPMPTAADETIIAKTRDGNPVLHYQNFSVLMHAKRRLALFTASNISREPDLREPDPSKQYTRKALSGLGKNDIEKWFHDPRLESKYQIPDVFFTKDRQAFDKGHLVRREDVCWGRTYDDVRRANGDSYHVTNCSPQVSGFNQSSRGEDNWGDLENHVLAEAASERLCVFAGPVLDPGDPVFHGVGEGGARLRARIPSRYWKVVVARVEGGIAAYGFVLEQDLEDVQFREFTVADEYIPVMTRIADIEAMTGVKFDTQIRDADQFESVRGLEIATRSGAGIRGS